VDGRSVELPSAEIAEESLGFFRWGRVAGKNLATTDAGDWAFLTDAELGDLLAGRVTDGHPRFEDLRTKGFLRDGLDLDALASRMTARNRHVSRGPQLHVVNLTLRGCRDAGKPDASSDMSAETAERIVELALQSTSPSVILEFQSPGGEPLLNFEVLRRAVDLARSRNEQSTGKKLTLRLLTNFSAMTDEIAEWLIANEVRIATSLDGPARLHDANRKWKPGSAHADVVRWIEHFHRRYAEAGRDAAKWHVDALATATRQSLGAAREIVDEYVARGLDTVHFRPLDRARFDGDAWKEIGYGTDEYLDFYRGALDYVIELNRRGVEIAERMASAVAAKIVGADDPGIVDLQSPSGDGTSQLAYDVNGHAFPCDEARIVDAAGDPIFDLGPVQKLVLSELVRHPTVRAIAAASLLDAQPLCADCWNKPFCGFSPVRNYLEQGDLFGQRLRSFEHKERIAVSAKLFEVLADEGDARGAEILERWAAQMIDGVDGRVSREAP
jgi:His-Xaa-Ser system radical SAM maturase HxsB